MPVCTRDAKLIELCVEGIKNMQKDMWDDGAGLRGRLWVDCRQQRLRQQVSIPGRESSFMWRESLFRISVDQGVRCGLHRWFSRGIDQGLDSRRYNLNIS